MSSIIKRLMPKSCPFTLTTEDENEVAYRVFLWGLGYNDNNQLYAAICAFAKARKGRTGLERGTLLRDWVSAYKWAAFYNFDVTRLKLAVFDAIVHEIDHANLAKHHFVKHGLTIDSADLYCRLLHDESEWPKFKQFLKGLAAPELLDELTLDWRKLVKECSEDFKKHHVSKGANFLAFRKLGFIARSNRMAYEDFANDLMERATGYYYRVRPFRTRLHAVNYAKSSLQGRALQLIDYWTDPSRERCLDGNTCGETLLWTNRLRSLNDALLSNYTGHPDAEMYTSLTPFQAVGDEW